MSFPPDTSRLDERQILQSVFDEDNRRLRVDAVATISNVSIAVDLDPSNDGVYVADKDTGNKLKVNADGSLNVITSSGLMGTSKNVFNEIAAIASGSETLLVSYTVPAATTTILERIVVSGENIAKYQVYINSIKVDVARTYFGSSLNTKFEYNSGHSDGYMLSASDILEITVLHNRPSTANFEGRIQIVEI